MLYFDSEYQIDNKNLLKEDKSYDVSFFRHENYLSNVEIKKDHSAIFFPGELHYCKVKDPKLAKKRFTKLLLKVTTK